MSGPRSAFSDQQDAHDKVQALLASKSLDELKKTEVSIKHEMDDKRQALRRLIGSRYRDIIQSATAINQMKSSVALLRDDLQALSKFIPEVQHDLDVGDQDLGAERAKQKGNGEGFGKTLIPKEVPPAQHQLLFVRRLRALSEAPDAISAFTEEKRWIEATSVYLRAQKLLHQVQRLCEPSETSSPSSSWKIPFDASGFVSTQSKKLIESKKALEMSAKVFLARNKLDHCVPTEDHQRNSRDLVQLLQNWKISLEQAKQFDLSLMLSIVEPSPLRPIAGLAASLEHASHAFASALSSLALLQDLNLSQLLSTFLAARLAAARFSLLKLMKSIPEMEKSRTQQAHETTSTPEEVKLELQSPSKMSNRNSTDDGLDATTEALCEWIRTIQWSIYIVFTNFQTYDKSAHATMDSRSQLNKPAQLPLLHLTMGAMLTRQLGLGIKDDLGFIGKKILQNWRNPLTPDFIQRETQQWLQSCLKHLPGGSEYGEIVDYSQNVNRTVLAQIESGQDLAHLESSIAYQIEHPLAKYVETNTDVQAAFSFPTSSPTWSGASTPNRSGSTTPRSGVSSSFWTSPSSLISTPLSSFGGVSASALLASAQITKWKTVSTSVCGKNMDMWTTFFHNLFLLRSHSIIARSFERVTLEGQLNLILKTTDHRSLALSGDLSAHSASQGINNGLVDEALLGNYVWSHGNDWTSSKVSDQLDRAHGLTPALRALVSAFDGQLSLIMSDLRPLIIIEDEMTTAGDKEESGTPSSPTTTELLQNDSQETIIVRRRYRSSTKSDVLPLLRAAIQRECVSLTVRLCGSLSHQIDSFTTIEQLKRDPKSNLQKALFLGRLTRALDTHSSQLRMILWQLEWASANATSSSFSLSSSSFTLLGSTGPKWMDRLSRKPLAALDSLSAASSSLPAAIAKYSVTASGAFQRTYHLAFAKWVEAVSDELTLYLSDFLNTPAPSSSFFTSASLRHGWVNANVGSTTESREMLVPSQPSPELLGWLREIVSLVYRAGAHNVDRFVLEYLVYSVSNSSLQVFASAVQNVEAKTASSRDLAIQLWFDIRFAYDVLSKRNLGSPFFQNRAVSSQLKASWDEVTETMNHVNKVEAIIATLKSKIDPVEVSFFAPHIAKYTKASIGQNQGLLGLLMAKGAGDSKRSSTLAIAGVTTSQDASSVNSLNCVKNVPRFATLPVSTISLSALREMNAASSAAAAAAVSANSSATNASADSVSADGSMGSGFDTDGLKSEIGGRSRQALEAAGSIWGKISEGVKGGWFS